MVGDRPTLASNGCCNTFTAMTMNALTLPTAWLPGLTESTRPPARAAAATLNPAAHTRPCSEAVAHATAAPLATKCGGNGREFTLSDTDALPFHTLRDPSRAASQLRSVSREQTRFAAPPARSWRFVLFLRSSGNQPLFPTVCPKSASPSGPRPQPAGPIPQVANRRASRARPRRRAPFPRFVVCRSSAGPGSAALPLTAGCIRNYRPSGQAGQSCRLKGPPAS